MNSIWVDLVHATHRRGGSRYRTRLIQQGTGPALIMLHGTGGHAEAFSRNIARMAKSFSVYAIDLLWHGQSEQPAFTGKTLEAWVDQVIDLMDSEGIETAFLEGESMGGWIGLYAALAHPHRIKGLVLNTTGGVKLPDEMLESGDLEVLKTRSIAAVTKPTAENVRTRLEWLMASPDRVTDELVQLRLCYYSDPQVQQGLRNVFNTQFDPVFRDGHELTAAQLRALQCPSLVLWTDKNPHRGVDAGRRIAELIPNSRFHCINDAAHWPQWEKPEEHDRVATEFLQSIR
jgi:pimeloyl-ACP methyl ester carboxylesterase